MDSKAHWKCPAAPTRNIDGTRLYLSNDETHPPQGEPINNLLDPDVYKDILILIDKEHASGKYLWHELITWNYCHYRTGTRNWFGWRTGDDFHWVLWKSGRFWWHDPWPNAGFLITRVFGGGSPKIQGPAFKSYGLTENTIHATTRVC